MTDPVMTGRIRWSARSTTLSEVWYAATTSAEARTLVAGLQGVEQLVAQVDIDRGGNRLGQREQAINRKLLASSKLKRTGERQPDDAYPSSGSPPTLLSRPNA